MNNKIFQGWSYSPQKGCRIHCNLLLLTLNDLDLYLGIYSVHHFYIISTHTVFAHCVIYVCVCLALILDLASNLLIPYDLDLVWR